MRILFRFRAELFDATYNRKEKKESKFLCDSCESDVDENPCLHRIKRKQGSTE